MWFNLLPFGLKISQTLQFIVLWREGPLVGEICQIASFVENVQVCYELQKKRLIY